MRFVVLTLCLRVLCSWWLLEFRIFVVCASQGDPGALRMVDLGG